MTRFLSLVVAFLCLLGSAVALATQTVSQLNVYNYSSGNVSTSAYTTLVAATAVSTRSVVVCDTSTHLLKIAVGAAGSELDFGAVMVSGCVTIPAYIPAGTRIAIKAIDASATTGYNVLTLVP